MPIDIILLYVNTRNRPAILVSANKGERGHNEANFVKYMVS